MVAPLRLRASVSRDDAVARPPNSRRVTIPTNFKPPLMRGGFFHVGYSAAARARSLSSKSSIRRAVAWGDFVYRASRL